MSDKYRRSTVVTFRECFLFLLLTMKRLFYMMWLSVSVGFGFLSFLSFCLFVFIFDLISFAVHIPYL